MFCIFIYVNMYLRTYADLFDSSPLQRTMADDTNRSTPIDPVLSLTAEGLWSDEDSADDHPSDTEEDEQISGPPKRVLLFNLVKTNPFKTRRKYEKEPPPHIRNLLARATSLYGSGDLQTARQTVNEIIKLDNKSVQAYTLLSHIYEDLGNMTEAGNAVFIAASIAKRDVALWIHAGRMSKDLGFWQQAIKCYDE